MTYAGDRLILDADSHVMEPVDFLDDVLEPAERDRFHRGMGFLAPRLEAGAVRARQRRSSPAAAAEAEKRLLIDKGWSAIGAHDSAERSRVLDLLGFQAQLVFPTYSGMFALALDNIFKDNAAVTGNVDLLYTWCRTVVNLFFAYDLSRIDSWKGLTDKLALSLSINNVFDQDPPHYSGSYNTLYNGYANGATVGRLAQFGVSKKF
jgi:outer membrane receptor protein involved in Fe transport